MNPDDRSKQKSHQQRKTGLTQALEGALERLREGLDQLAEGFRPQQPQRVPVPVPVRRPSRR